MVVASPELPGSMTFTLSPLLELGRWLSIPVLPIRLDRITHMYLMASAISVLTRLVLSVRVSVVLLPNARTLLPTPVPVQLQVRALITMFMAVLPRLDIPAVPVNPSLPPIMMDRSLPQQSDEKLMVPPCLLATLNRRTPRL